MSTAEVGLRVKVYTSKDREYIGTGFIDSFVVVPFPDGRLIRSPIIKLDNGDIVKGYMCWWVSAEDARRLENEADKS